MSGGDIRAVREQLRDIIYTIGVHDDRAVLVGELQHIINLAQHALRTAVLAEQRAGGFAADGFLNVKSWLSHHTDLSTAAAGSLYKQARHLSAMPHTSAAAAQGVMSEQRVQLLVKCRVADPERYDEATDQLFSSIEDTKALALAVRKWLQAAQDDKPPATTEFGLWLSETLDGNWRLDGNLAPGDGKLLDEAIQKHLRPMLNARRDGDPSLEFRSIPELRAQALVDIADGDLRLELPDMARTNRHRINLVVHWDSDGEFNPEVPLPQEAWCDATFTRLVMGASSQILNVGRATRNWPEDIAVAVYGRDRHCTFPGCDIAANRCEASTTAPTGNTAAPPASTTPSCSAEDTTSSSTNTTGTSTSTSTSTSSSDNQTAPHSSSPSPTAPPVNRRARPASASAPVPARRRALILLVRSVNKGNTGNSVRPEGDRPWRTRPSHG